MFGLTQYMIKNRHAFDGAIESFHVVIASADDEWGGRWRKCAFAYILSDNLGIAPEGADAGCWIVTAGITMPFGVNIPRCTA